MERMEEMLLEAAMEGNVPALLQLLQRDKLILDRVIANCVTETPLHVAAMLGHLDFVMEVVRRKPELARELDSRRSSPLHLASAKGYTEIAQELLKASPDMCLARDVDGRNPLHLAAMKGHVGLLQELIRARPQAALAKAAWGETILHLCVKYKQLEALRMLVEVMDDKEFVNAKDDYGMTILHLAVDDKQIEMVNFLLSSTRIEVNAENANGFTALDILTRSRRDVQDFEIGECLRGAGAIKATDISVSAPANKTTKGQKKSTALAPVPSSSELQKKGKKKKQNEWLSKKRDALMVVASLIATVAFQAALTPPAGLWQDDSEHSAGSTPPAAAPAALREDDSEHSAGSSIMADKDPSTYTLYLSLNTASFTASLSIILLLVTGLPFTPKLFMWILTVIVWIAITTMALTYVICILASTRLEKETTVSKILAFAVVVWCLVMALLLLMHTLRLFATLVKKIARLCRPKRRRTLDV